MCWDDIFLDIKQACRDVENGRYAFELPLSQHSNIWPDRLRASLTAARVMACALPEIHRIVTGGLAEPKERSERQGVGVEEYPDHAAIRFGSEVQIYVNPTCFRKSVAGFELYVSEHPVAFQDHVVATPIDLRSEHLDLANTSKPETAEHLADKDMLNQLFPETRIR